MTRTSFAAAVAALLLALPAAATAESPEQLAIGQERAYMQQAPPATAVERALAQERTYTQSATVATTPARPTATPDDGAPVGLLSAVAAGLLLAVAVGLTARRRHIHRPRLAGSAS